MIVFSDTDFTVAEVMEIFSHASWTAHRTYDQVSLLLVNTDIVVMGKYENKPVAFARVITDKVTRAFLEDVIVIPEYRGTGVSRLLLDEIYNRVHTMGMNRIEANTQTPEFWKKVGWTVREDNSLIIKRF